MPLSSFPAMELEGVVPNWLELPRDITVNILERLDTIDIVTKVCHVCPLWWNIFKDPLMWRTISMTKLNKSCSDLLKICQYAIERSCGCLEDIDIKSFGTNDLLKNIAENGSHIQCLRLVDCAEISDEGMIQVAKQFPLLEELDILYNQSLSENFLEAIGQSCPLLKSLIYSRSRNRNCDGEAIAIGKTMTELRHLKIHRNFLTDEGLLAILDGCPLLESLDLQNCRCIEFTDNLKNRCQEQINFLCLPQYLSLKDFHHWRIYHDDSDYYDDYDSNSEYECDYEDDDF